MTQKFSKNISYMIHPFPCYIAINTTNYTGKQQFSAVTVSLKSGLFRFLGFLKTYENLGFYSASVLLAMHTAVLARPFPSVCLPVCPSVIPSRSGIVSRRMKIRSCGFQHLVWNNPSSFWRGKVYLIFAGDHPHSSEKLPAHNWLWQLSATDFRVSKLVTDGYGHYHTDFVITVTEMSLP